MNNMTGTPLCFFEDVETAPGLKIGFKVVSRDCKSVLVFGEHAKKIYKKDVSVTPSEGCGPMCVFADLPFSIDFINTFFWAERFEDTRLFMCEYKPSDIKSIWSHYSSEPIYLKELSKGTVLADSVTLLQEINWSDS